MKLGPASNTRAILVGIEKYGEDRWELNGPAMDALRMAEWLLSQGVPGRNIQLYLSFGNCRDETHTKMRDALLKTLTDHGVQPDYPSRANLEDGLNNARWPDLEGGQDSTLLVYFSGHGLQSPIKGERYVIAADANEKSYDAINLEALALALRLDDSPRGYKRQLIIQDACAEYVRGRPVRALDYKHQDSENTSNLQYCLFATRPGEFGRNSPELQAGEFTTALLDILRSGSLEGQDVGAVYKTLEKTMQGRSQHPVLYRRDEHLAEWTVEPGRQPRATALQELIEVVSGLRSVNASLFPPICRDIAQSDLATSPDIGVMLRCLDSLIGPPDQGLTNVELFAVRLLDKIERIVASATGVGAEHAEALNALQGWIDAWPGKRAGPAVTKEQQRLEDERKQIDDLRIIVLDPGGELDANETRVWYYNGTQFSTAETIPTPAASIAERLSIALQAVCAKGVSGDMILELVLPFDVLFDKHGGTKIVVEKFLNYYLGARPLLLALRIAERWQTTGWYNSWQSRWKKAGPSPDAIPKIVWLAPKERLPASGWAWIGMENPATPEHLQAIRQALYEGAAFATWCGRTHAEAVTNTVTGRNYLDLLETRQLLADMNDNDNNNVTCMIDDATRLPPGAGGLISTLHQPSPRS